MASSLSNVVDNFSKRIHKIKCTNWIKCCLEYTNYKRSFIEFKYLCCNKIYQNKFDENLKKKFANTYKSANQDTNKFILLLQKGVYPYEYIDDWEKSNEMSLPEKEDFFSHLNMEDISDADYKHKTSP